MVVTKLPFMTMRASLVMRAVFGSGEAFVCVCHSMHWLFSPFRLIAKECYVPCKSCPDNQRGVLCALQKVPTQSTCKGAKE